MKKNYLNTLRNDSVTLTDSRSVAKIITEWKNDQCFTYIPKWKRFIIHKFGHSKWIKNLFNYGFETFNSINADNTGTVKTVCFKLGNKVISSCNFFYNLNNFQNEEDKTSSLN